MLLRTVAITLCSVLLLTSCGNPSAKNSSIDSGKKTPKKTQISANTKPLVDSQLNAFARFIAGLPCDYSKIKAHQSSEWKNFAAKNNAMWENLENKLSKPIAQWVTQTKLSVENEPRSLFYPFAGGDFFYANLFFPQHDTLIMIGLEPGGSTFNPDATSTASLNEYYSNLNFSMFFPHKLGFFRTKSMDKDFKKGPLNGTLHTVLFYMSRAGYQIEKLSYFNLDKEGKSIDETSAVAIKNGEKFIGYKINYFKEGDTKARTLYYVSYDASNENLKSNPGLIQWLNGHQRINVFFKAASYLMHYDQFSTIRNYVLNHAVRVFQDDSGLPYKTLLNHQFEVELYGKYTRTINLFKAEFQPELKDAYANKTKASVPFLIGYNAEFGECNLQHAIKKK